MTLKIDSLFGVAGKTALVTGGSAGIGKMIAGAFAANGVKVYITGRDEGRLQAAAAELSELGECIGVQADLGAMAGVEALAAELAAREGKLDILVNNAGTSWVAGLANAPEKGWDKVFDTNVKAPFFLTQKLLPLLEAAASDEAWARIINISSMSARSFVTATIMYNASKAAVEQMTRTMSKSLGGQRITVNAIAPGWFPSPMNDKNPPEAGENWKKGASVKRFGTAEDIGGAALFLCSRAGAFVDGQVIDLDGGRMGG